MRTLVSATAALAAGLVLAACGGGNSSDGGMTPPPAPQDATAVPGSAIASAAAMVSYLGALQLQDVAEPLTLPSVDAAVSETDEPLPLS
ncbi:hypothetical protein [Roseateles saccharophilus]|uniref:Uncharacterized protein n=1 Tax=Roseateles saccharophilus TaxID=304 RepID=A0A4R3UJ38_ROSSA|nr:hypothetical protein [Roseateles saccharophilus]MDG0834053.1 hypothetical protein [Roseateles saccharophilus]TCU90782.1 hypothetical protein EV671_10293 [Roseateles saccharophilus]